MSTPVTMMLVFLVGMTTLGGAQDNNTSCAQNLVPCANYINSKSTPAANCCSSIKDAVANQLPCLCNLYTAPGLLQSFNITVQQALNLSRACGVTTDLTKCNSNIFYSFPLLILGLVDGPELVSLVPVLQVFGFGPPVS